MTKNPLSAGIAPATYCILEEHFAHVLVTNIRTCDFVYFFVGTEVIASILMVLSMLNLLNTLKKYNNTEQHLWNYIYKYNYNFLIWDFKNVYIFGQLTWLFVHLTGWL